jgi:hypothetical protein
MGREFSMYASDAKYGILIEKPEDRKTTCGD